MAHVPHYPTAFPRDELTEVIAYLQSPVGPAAHAIESAWHCLGFGLSFIPSGPATPPLIFKKGGPPARTTADSLAVLESALAEGQKVGGPGAQAIPWQSLLTVLWSLLQEWLSSK